MTALQIFRIVAQEFSSIPDDDTTDEETGTTTIGVNTYLELYADQISKKRFGAMYEKALAYLTAHKLKMQGYGSDESGGIGTIADALRVSSYSEGETSISFGTSQSANLEVDGEYALTIYGIEFLAIKRSVIIPIINAGENTLWE